MHVLSSVAGIHWGEDAAGVSVMQVDWQAALQGFLDQCQWQSGYHDSQCRSALETGCGWQE